MSCTSCLTAVPTMGPRQATGDSRGSTKPNETSLTPYFSAVVKPPSPSAMKPDSKPIMMGTLGPVTSASRRPTRAPCFANATARLTETVVLPTPPLLLAMAMMLRTPSTGRALPPGWFERTSASIFTSTSVTPGRPRIISSACAFNSFLTGHAGVVRTMRRLTLLLSTLRS